MSECQRCKGTAKMVQVSAKCSDMYWQRNLKTGKEYDGYVKDWISSPMGGGDYVSFTVCRHCGQLQGAWPESDKSIDKFKHGKVS